MRGRPVHGRGEARRDQGPARRFLSTTPSSRRCRAHAVEEVDKVILTASGGPFRDWTREAMSGARPEEAVKHPNWSMGPKISVDLATLMNKGSSRSSRPIICSVSPSEQLDVLIHPQSIVHGMVAYRDGSMIAELSTPDMRLPIGLCLAWPARSKVAGARLDLARVGKLTFERPDVDRFPALKPARNRPGSGRLGNKYSQCRERNRGCRLSRRDDRLPSNCPSGGGNPGTGRRAGLHQRADDDQGCACPRQGVGRGALPRRLLDRRETGSRTAREGGPADAVT